MLRASRLIQALLLFASGALLSWWLTAAAPSHTRDQATAPDPALATSPASHRGDATIASADEAVAGRPPASVTPPQPAPNAAAGQQRAQKRALTRAIERLETDPPVTGSVVVDQETTARVSDRLRARLTERGAPR